MAKQSSHLVSHRLEQEIGKELGRQINAFLWEETISINCDECPNFQSCEKVALADDIDDTCPMRERREDIKAAVLSFSRIMARVTNKRFFR